MSQKFRWISVFQVSVLLLLVSVHNTVFRKHHDSNTLHSFLRLLDHLVTDRRRRIDIDLSFDNCLRFSKALPARDFSLFVQLCQASPQNLTLCLQCNSSRASSPCATRPESSGRHHPVARGNQCGSHKANTCSPRASAYLAYEELPPAFSYKIKPATTAEHTIFIKITKFFTRNTKLSINTILDCFFGTRIHQLITHNSFINRDPKKNFFYVKKSRSIFRNHQEACEWKIMYFGLICKQTCR
ncbi:hypothetical protein PUN28_019413 [Cardiocondyla obscurior]|uniref:Uncharacterized protein n=1 Tax=Cardiocondyla obscurior TaxID=286306 RepID=A0AAW2EH77_9HYME